MTLCPTHNVVDLAHLPAETPPNFCTRHHPAVRLTVAADARTCPRVDCERWLRMGDLWVMVR